MGTKQLIEDYIEEVSRQLSDFAGNIEIINNHIELRMKADVLKHLRHALGNTALLLSGGGSLGVYHVGVVKGILEAGTLPRIIAGSSAGAIIASMICTRNEDEYEKLTRFEGISYTFMEAPLHELSLWSNILKKVKRWFFESAVYDSDYMESTLKENLGDITFLVLIFSSGKFLINSLQEAFRKTGRVLNITVSSATSYEMPSLLNYITAPDVLVWSAVMASCALPGIFKSAPLFAKDTFGKCKPWHHVDNKWIDGSVENDIPLKKLSEMFNVNHFIVSQVNPHIYPFLLLTPVAKACGSVYEKLFILFMTEAKFRVNQLSKTGLFRKGFRVLQNILEQPYQGDINIVPRLAMKDLLNFFTDLDFESLNRALIAGQRAAWPSKKCC